MFTRNEWFAKEQLLFRELWLFVSVFSLTISILSASESGYLTSSLSLINYYRLMVLHSIGIYDFDCLFAFSDLCFDFEHTSTKGYLLPQCGTIQDHESINQPLPIDRAWIQPSHTVLTMWLRFFPS